MKSNEPKEIISQLLFEPLSKNNWDKFVQLFGSRGACSNCWCMSFRRNKSDFMEGKQNDGNKKLMKKLVWENKPTGILGFYKGQAIAWCAFAPREVFVKLENSRVHKRIDDKSVWSIPCFFIDKGFRRKGVSVVMLKAIIKYAKEKISPVIEAYPTIPTQDKLPDALAGSAYINRLKKQASK